MHKNYKNLFVFNSPSKLSLVKNITNSEHCDHQIVSKNETDICNENGLQAKAANDLSILRYFLTFFKVLLQLKSQSIRQQLIFANVMQNIFTDHFHVIHNGANSNFLNQV